MASWAMIGSTTRPDIWASVAIEVARARRPVAVLEVPQHARPRHAVAAGGGEHRALPPPAEIERHVAAAEQHDFPGLGRQFLPRRVEVEAELLADLGEVVERETAVQQLAVVVEGVQRTVAQRLAGVL